MTVRLAPGIRAQVAGRVVYERSPEALALRCRRAELSLMPARAAKRLGLTAVELMDLETGERVPADPGDWRRLLAALEAETR